MLLQDQVSPSPLHTLVQVADYAERFLSFKALTGYTRRAHYAYCISQRSARKYGMRAGRASRTGTYVLERHLRHIMVVRCGIGIRARRHAILEVSRVRL